MSESHESINKWESSLDSSLVERLSKPLVKPGVINGNLSKSVFLRNGLMVNKHPLLNRLIKKSHLNTGESHKNVPIVYKTSGSEVKKPENYESSGSGTLRNTFQQKNTINNKAENDPTVQLQHSGDIKASRRISKSASELEDNSRAGIKSNAQPSKKLSESLSSMSLKEKVNDKNSKIIHGVKGNKIQSKTVKEPNEKFYTNDNNTKESSSGPQRIKNDSKLTDQLYMQLNTTPIVKKFSGKSIDKTKKVLLNSPISSKIVQKHRMKEDGFAGNEKKSIVFGKQILQKKKSNTINGFAGAIAGNQITDNKIQKNTKIVTGENFLNKKSDKSETAVRPDQTGTINSNFKFSNIINAVDKTGNKENTNTQINTKPVFSVVNKDYQGSSTVRRKEFNKQLEMADHGSVLKADSIPPTMPKKFLENMKVISKKEWKKTGINFTNLTQDNNPVKKNNLGDNSINNKKNLFLISNNNNKPSHLNKKEANLIWRKSISVTQGTHIPFNTVNDNKPGKQNLNVNKIIPSSVMPGQIVQRNFTASENIQPVGEVTNVNNNVPQLQGRRNGIDINRIAEKVSKILYKKLLIEKERRGHGRWD